MGRQVRFAMNRGIAFAKIEEQEHKSSATFPTSQSEDVVHIASRFPVLDDPLVFLQSVAFKENRREMDGASRANTSDMLIAGVEICGRKYV